MSYTPNIAIAYAVTALVLALNLVGLWMYSGIARARSGITNNPEDGARWGKPVQEHDPPAVARVLRAHANAAAMTYPFLFLGAAYVLLNGNPVYAWVMFAVFALARVLHSIAHVRGWQPARSILFGISLFMLLALAGFLVARALHVSAVT